MSHHPRFVKYDDLKAIRVDRFEGLEVEALLSWARDHVDIESYLPSYKYKRAPNREWLCNICKHPFADPSVHSLKPVEFKAYIKEKLKAREQMVFVKKVHTIDCIPEVADAFEHTSHVSSKNRHLTFF